MVVAGLVALALTAPMRTVASGGRAGSSHLPLVCLALAVFIIVFSILVLNDRTGGPALRLLKLLWPTCHARFGRRAGPCWSRSRSFRPPAGGSTPWHGLPQHHRWPAGRLVDVFVGGPGGVRRLCRSGCSCGCVPSCLPSARVPITIGQSRRARSDPGGRVGSVRRHQISRVVDVDGMVLGPDLHGPAGWSLPTLLEHQTRSKVVEWAFSPCGFFVRVD